MNIDTSKIKGLIFDMDGTLADTMPLHLEVWNEVGAKYGLSLSHDEHLKLAGMPTEHIVSMLAKEKGLNIDAKEFTKQKEHLFLNEKLANVQPIPIVADFVYSLQGKFPMAVGTGSQRGTAEKVIHYLKMENYINALVSADDVENHKPAPDTFLACAEKIGIAPENCLVFEDANLGMQSARNGGMQAINITETPKETMLSLLEELKRQ